MGRLKTLILTHCYPPDGGTFIKHRAERINAAVLTMGRPLGFWNFVRFVNDAVGSARKYDRMEAHWLFPAGVAAMIASWITKVPYRVYCHGTDVMMAERSWFWRLLAKRVIRRAEGTRCVSWFLADKLLRFQSEVTLIDPMPVDKSIFYDMGLERRTVILITKKNNGRYTQVYDEVFQRFPQAIAVEANGTIPQYRLCHSFNRARVVVLASENEGYGLMLGEAACCGAHVIGVNEGGIPEVIERYGGQLFDGTAADLIAKIELALIPERTGVA